MMHPIKEALRALHWAIAFTRKKDCMLVIYLGKENREIIIITRDLLDLYTTKR